MECEQDQFSDYSVHHSYQQTVEEIYRWFPTTEIRKTSK